LGESLHKGGEDAQDQFIIAGSVFEANGLLDLGARKLGGKKIRTGRTIFFASTDLAAWDFKGDFWAANLFYMHEVPDIFRIGDV
jgi:beta-fructofuranosidase